MSVYLPSWECECTVKRGFSKSPATIKGGVACPICGASPPQTMTHQQLFDSWYEARRSVIHERSGSIAADMRALHAKATNYATAHGLSFVIELDDWHREDDDQ